MSSIRAVFWDSDNTLVDTGVMHWRKHVAVLEECGIVLDEQYRPRIYTNNGQQNWDWISRELGLGLSQGDYLSRIDGWYADHIGEIEIRPGVTELVALVQAAGLRQAVVSNGRRVSVLLALEACGIAPAMDFILCKEDYEGRKPDPAPYLAALERMNREFRLGLRQDECLVIEDDPKGVESACRAGMRVIHRKLTADQPDAQGAEAHVFDPFKFRACFEAMLQL